MSIHLRFFILLGAIAVVGLALACSSGPSEAQAELTRNREKWESSSIEDYSFTYRNICFCPYTDPVTLTVRGGSIESAMLVDSGEIGATDRYKTVDDLFDLVQDAIDEDAHSIEVTYDSALGYPTSGSIDYAQNIVDEEFGFTAEDLVRLE